MVDDRRVGDWERQHIVEFFDARTEAIGRAAAALSMLSDDDKRAALDTISRHVTDQASRLSDHDLSNFAVSVVDDLYRTLAHVEIWLPEAGAYVASAHGAFFAHLATRGFRVRYIVENVFTDGLERLIDLIPLGFRTTGFAFVCREVLAQTVATNQIDGQHRPLTLTELKPWRSQGRWLADQLVVRADQAGGHLAVLSADFEEGDLDRVMHLPDRPGTITVFRNEVPEPGSKVNVRMT